MNIHEYLKNYPEIVAIIKQYSGRSADDVESITFSQDVDGYIDKGGIRRLVPGGNKTLTIAFFDGSKHMVDISARPISWVPVLEKEKVDEQ